MLNNRAPTPLAHTNNVLARLGDDVPFIWDDHGTQDIAMGHNRHVHDIMCGTHWSGHGRHLGKLLGAYVIMARKQRKDL